MDVKKIKTRKAEVESEILDMLLAFEKETGIYIRYASAKVDRYGEYDLPTAGANEKRKRKAPKGLYDFDIEIALEKSED